MSPLRQGSGPFLRCFPRVSGDEPVVFQVMRIWPRFSPREWG